MGEIFERACPQVALEWTGERLVTGVGGQIEIEHLHRYAMARDYCRNLDVLDVASGEGYGTALLSAVARSVTGVEIAAGAVDHAGRNYQADNLRFLQGDARKIPLPDASVDVVTSFETIEHFYEQGVFLEEVRRVLRPQGRFIVSSPDRDTYSPAASEANPYHKRELSRGEFEDLLRGAFSYVRLLCQRPMLGSVLLSDDGDPGPTFTIERRGDRHFERSTGVSRSPYLVAVASDADLAPLGNSIFVETGEVGPVMARAANHPHLAAAYLEAKTRAEQAETALAAFQRQAEPSAREEASSPSVIEQRDVKANIRSEATIEAGRDGFFLSASAIGPLADDRDGVLVPADHAQIDNEHAAALSNLRQVCIQRDMARLALRRCHIQAEQLWSPRLEALQQVIESLRAELGALHEQVQMAEASNRDWQGRYERLRRSLEGFLFRSGLFRASRLLPPSVRREIRARVFPAQSA